MKCNYEEDNEILKVLLTQDIDTGECKKIRNVIDGYIIKYQPKKVVLDLSNVSFMDSSGIGLVMGRYNLAKMFNSKLAICNPNKRIKQVIQLTNIDKYVEIMEV
ncbi:MAG: STAS domain-containing protein [Clostridia bacterium]